MTYLNKPQYVNWEILSDLEKATIAVYFNEYDRKSLNQEETLKSTIEYINNFPYIIDEKGYKDLADYAKLNERRKDNAFLVGPRIHASINYDILTEKKYTITMTANNQEVKFKENDYEKALEKAKKLFDINPISKITIENNHNTYNVDQLNPKDSKIVFIKTEEKEIDYQNIQNYKGPIDEKIFHHLYNYKKPKEAVTMDYDTVHIIFEELNRHNISLHADNNKIYAQYNNRTFNTEMEDIFETVHESLFDRAIRPVDFTNIEEITERRLTINDYKSNYLKTKKLEKREIIDEMLHGENSIYKKNATTTEKEIKKQLDKDILDAISKYHVTGNNLLNVLYNKDKILYERIDEFYGHKAEQTINQINYENNQKLEKQITFLIENKKNFQEKTENELLKNPKTSTNILNKKLTENLQPKQIENILTKIKNIAKSISNQNKENENTKKKTTSKGRK